MHSIYLRNGSIGIMSDMSIMIGIQPSIRGRARGRRRAAPRQLWYADPLVHGPPRS